MSGEDETFDIDLYGDEEQDNVGTTYDGTIEAHKIDVGEQTTSASPTKERNSTPDIGSISQAQPCASITSTSNPQDSTTSLTQGTKRKAADDTAPDDGSLLDPGAQVSIKLTELQWWTTEDDLRVYCVKSNVERELVEVAFNEHKINGKSKGEAYMEFRTCRAAGMTKKEVEKGNETSKTKISVWYTAPGNPFRVRDGLKKDAGSKFGGNQGAYNHFPSQNRGGYSGGRGRGNYNNAGRGGHWQNQHQPTQNSNANQMMGGFGNIQFPAFNAMNMNQNLMNTMMGMGMNMQNMMAGRGGMMNNRGGWNNAGARGGMAAQQGSFPNNNGWDGNKRPRRE